MNLSAKFAQSVDLLQRGQLDAAEALCREVVLAQPEHADALHVLAVITLQKGDIESGIELMRQSLALNADQPHVLCNLGNAWRDLKRHEDALLSYRRAIALAPDFAGAHYSEGNALADLNRPEEALASYERALALQANYAEAHQNRGNVLLGLGRPEEALESYRSALNLQPNSVIALANCAHALRLLKRPSEALDMYARWSALQPRDTEPLIARGNLLLELGRYDQAIECFDRVLLQNPDAPDARFNRGYARFSLNQFEGAIADFDEVLERDPALAEAHCNRGRCLLKLERFDEALASFTEAVRLKPFFTDAMDGSGIALQALKRFDEARGAFAQALDTSPDSVDILYRLAVALRHLRRHEEAALYFSRVVGLAPDYDFALGNLLHERVQNCDWTGYAETLEAIERSLARGKKAYLPGPFFTVSNSAEAQLRCARIFVADKQLEALPAAAFDPRSHRHDRIRVAYVSADFREHPIANLITGVLESHDRGRFEVTGISLQPEERSPIGQRIRAAFDEFIDVTRSSDREVAALLRELEIDIAVDLMGFSGGGRPAIFAHRAAPVQVNHLGFAGTLGARYMDYMIADRVVIPAADRASFTEKIAFMPHCFQPNDRRRPLAERQPTRAQSGLPERAFVFCCFNSHYKISPAVFDVWMRLLDRIEGSVLWLPQGTETVTRNLRREALERGIAAERLVFAPRLPDLADHLARYSLADLFLDTLPYNAHTTASDALWAGLPVLTCQGGAFAARVAASLLTTVGLPELIASNIADYEALAGKLASTPEWLAELRARLAKNRLTSPLFDTTRYCRDLETAYSIMWRRWQAGQTPEDFAVDVGR